MFLVLRFFEDVYMGGPAFLQESRSVPALHLVGREIAVETLRSTVGDCGHAELGFVDRWPFGIGHVTYLIYSVNFIFYKF